MSFKPSDLAIRAFRYEIPVIVFASSDPEHVRENRLKALSLGAFEYTWTFRRSLLSYREYLRDSNVCPLDGFASYSAPQSHGAT